MEMAPLPVEPGDESSQSGLTTDCSLGKDREPETLSQTPWVSNPQKS